VIPENEGITKILLMISSTGLVVWAAPERVRQRVRPASSGRTDPEQFDDVAGFGRHSFIA
jgi:hypothetical protein